MSGLPANVVDLEDKIAPKSAQALNIVDGADVSDVLSGNGLAALESDVDEQLLITVPFSSHIKLRGLRIVALEATDASSGPKEVRLYVNQPNMSFEDVDSIKPAQVIELTPEHLAGKPIEVKPLPFANTLSVTVFVASNQDGTDRTRINSLRFFGFAPSGTDMSKLESQKCTSCGEK